MFAHPFLFIGQVSSGVDASMGTLDGQADMVYCADATRTKCMVAHEYMTLSLFLDFRWNAQKKVLYNLDKHRSKLTIYIAANCTVELERR